MSHPDDMVPLCEFARSVCQTTRTLVSWSQDPENDFPRVYWYGKQWFIKKAEADKWRESRPGEGQQVNLRHSIRHQHALDAVEDLYAP